ncbi:MAG: hypothetical protein V3V08_09915 [Nannocystaceae bacterium]
MMTRYFTRYGLPAIAGPLSTAACSDGSDAASSAATGGWEKDAGGSGDGAQSDNDNDNGNGNDESAQDDDEGDGNDDSDASGEDTESDAPPPDAEDEHEGSFDVPQTSGKYVYSASTTTHRVAIIDTETLDIDVVDAGRSPTVVAALQPEDASAGAGAVAVLSQGSDQVTLITTTSAGNSTVRLHDVASHANNLAVSPRGRFVISYHDLDIADDTPSGNDQEISVIVAADLAKNYAFAVGSHPSDVAFSADGNTAYVVTDDGVSVIPLEQLDQVGKPDLVPVTEETGIDPSTVEVQLAAQAGLALARMEGEKMLLLTDLSDGSQIKLELDGYPTDVDIAEDGSFAILMLPREGGSTLLEVPLPLASAGDVASTKVNGEYVGVSQLAPNGDTMLLYTTVNPWADEDDADDHVDPRQRLTIARRASDGAWSDFVSVFTEIPIRSVGIAPDSANAILLHAKAEQLNPSAPWPYTLLDLQSEFPIRKLQNVEAPPASVLFTPDGRRSAILVRDDTQSVRRVDMVDLSNFIVSGITLGSPPEGAGYVHATDKIFVSQVHDSGRITFVDAQGDVQTTTGFELNDSVKD